MHMKERGMIRGNKHGFTKGKFFLTNPVAFSGGIIAPVDKARATDDIYLNFSKAFDMVPYNILLSELESFDRWNCSMDEELAAQLYLECGGQCLDAWMGISVP